MNDIHPVIIPILLFTIWTLALTIFVVGFRTVKVLQGQKKSNEFPAWEKHGEGFYWRLHRSQQNCIEYLPIFATISVLGILLEIEDPLFVNFAYSVFGGRLFQTLSHWSGEGVWNVNFRFSGLAVQLVGFVGMIILLCLS